MNRSTIIFLLAMPFLLGLVIGYVARPYPSRVDVQTVEVVRPSTSVTATRFVVKLGSVYDGDTFRILDYDGADGRVRFARIDAPELDEPGGISSRDRLRELIDGKEVEIRFSEPDGRRRGAYGRLLLSVSVDGEDVVSILVAEGLVEWRMDQEVKP